MNPIAFRPELPKSAEPLLQNFMERLEVCRRSPTLLLGVVRSLLDHQWFNNVPTHDHLATRLFLEVVEDLLQQGWVFDRRSDDILAHPPDLTAIKGSDKYELKRWLRSSLAGARDEQLGTDAASRFIREMERPKRFQGRRVSVLDLFLSPRVLANDLLRRGEASEPLRSTLLREAVSPYLQLVTNERDRFTNLRLVDIWRYCRQTWSLPHNPQPGRQLLYLVRDASRENHPIMGIGALGNSVIQISCRDDAIGWTLPSLKKDPNRSSMIAALEDQVRSAIREVYWEDLLSDADLHDPTPEVLDYLQRIIQSGPVLSRYADARRGEPILSDTLSPLYRKKRAQELHSLLGALRVFRASGTTYTNQEGRSDWLLRSNEGQKALRVALRCLKKRHIGTSLMEITTCGAVHPYSSLLGGKLVALLMASPTVICHYRDRYHGSPSEIASRMRGSSVTKDSHLVMLGTTSLYAIGSSQYSRVRFPSEWGNLQYQYVGNTRGFGSVHISGRTYQTLKTLLQNHPRLTPESSAFATGVNYKMRSLVSGLSFIGANRLQQHGNQRRVYVVPLARNWREYLLGLEERPDYPVPIDDQSYTQRLIEHWKDRWFIGRAQNRNFVHLMANSTEKIQVSGILRKHENTVEVPLAPTVLASGRVRGEGDLKMQTVSWQTLAELIRHRGSFAELLSPEELDVIHVPSKLDTHLLDLVIQGARVYVTGSPGDGKTHIIQKFIEELNRRGIYVNLDASAQDESALLRGLLPLIQENKPAVIAINEGPLRRLLKHLPEDETKSIREQLDRPYRYGEETLTVGSTVVVNLGIRRVLARPFVEGAFDFVTNRVNYGGAPPGMAHNVEMINRPRVRERIQTLLQHVSSSGAHVTMNQLMGFMSFIITGGITNAASPVTVRPYYELVFDDANPLHQWLGQVDPVNIAHPLVDMWIWDGDYPSTVEWLEPFDLPEPRSADSRELAEHLFSRTKRKFFFESIHGSQILEMLPSDHKQFFELLRSTAGGTRETAKRRLLEALALYFGHEGTSTDSQIPIWTRLRYEAIAPPTAFISSKAVPVDKVSLDVPQLHCHLENLLEYEPSELRLSVAPRSVDREPVGLNIDLELWLALMRLDRGMPQRFLDPRVGRRLNLFMARLAAEYKSDGGFVTLQVRDVESGKVLVINVSMESGKYVI